MTTATPCAEHHWHLSGHSDFVRSSTCAREEYWSGVCCQCRVKRTAPAVEWTTVPFRADSLGYEELTK